MNLPIIWEKIPVGFNIWGKFGGNEICHITDKAYISYQDFEEGGRSEILEAMNTLMTGDTKTDDETALYDGKTWRILWGNHKKAYEKAIPKGVEECIKVYSKLKKTHGCDKWSTE